MGKSTQPGSSNQGPYEAVFIPMQHSTADIERAIKKVSRHPLSQRFHQLLSEAGEMHDRKQEDYGLDNDPFHNVRSSSDFGVPGWVGCMIRADDKMKRLKKFSQKGELRNESVADSFMDLAVYALIGLVLYEEES